MIWWRADTATGRSLAGSARWLHSAFVISYRPGSALTQHAVEPRMRAAWQDFLERTRRAPGVQATTQSDIRPQQQRRPKTNVQSYSPDQDRAGNPSVVVIDEVIAQQAFAGEEPLDKHLWIGLGSDPVTVVGVVSHVQYDDKGKLRAQLYYPFAKVSDEPVRRWLELISIYVRTGVEPTSVIESLRRELRGASADQVLYERSSLARPPTLPDLALRHLCRPGTLPY